MKEQEIRDNEWNPYLVNNMSYKNETGNRWSDFCNIAHKNFCDHFGISTLPKPEERKYSILRIYAGVNQCNQSHLGISVAKLMHAYTTYCEILAYEQMIGKDNDVEYLEPILFEEADPDPDPVMNMSAEALLK